MLLKHVRTTLGLLDTFNPRVLELRALPFLKPQVRAFKARNELADAPMTVCYRCCWHFARPLTIAPIQPPPPPATCSGAISDSFKYSTGFFDEENKRIIALAEAGEAFERYELTVDEALALWRVLMPTVNVENIAQSHTSCFNMQRGSFDVHAPRLLDDGRTLSVFRFESHGMNGSWYTHQLMTLPQSASEPIALISKEPDCSRGPPSAAAQ